MEKEEANGGGSSSLLENDLRLQWGHRKRLRCFKFDDVSDGGGGGSSGEDRFSGVRRRRRRLIWGDYAGGADSCPSSPPAFPSPLRSEQRQSPRSVGVSSSPEKEDSGRCYTTRGWAAAIIREDDGVQAVNRDRAIVLPRFFVSLSNKEKEEDFMAMKGCKLPQRPKKRAKLIQKALLLVSPGAWLSDLSQERYEVREKKSSRKRRRGLKAMCLESDSE